MIGVKRYASGFIICFSILAAVVLGEFAADALPTSALVRPLSVSAVIALLLAFIALWAPWGALVASLAAVLLVAWTPLLQLAAGTAVLLLVIVTKRGVHFDVTTPILVASVVFLIGGIIGAASVLEHPMNEGGIGGDLERAVYIVLLDGYPRVDTLAGHGINIRPFIDELEARGFDYYPDSRSEHSYSYRTLEAMFGAKSPAEDGFGDVRDRRASRAKWRLPRGFVSISTSLDHVTAPGARELYGRGLSQFEFRLLGRTPFAAFESSQRWLIRSLRKSVDSVLSKLEHTKEQHVFAHVMAPHGPFLYSSDGDIPLLPPCWPKCNPFDHEILHLGISLEEWTAGMAAYLEVLNPRVLEVVDSLVSKDPDAIVVLLSDHGARYLESEKDEWFRSFLAVRTPGVERAFGPSPTPRVVVRKVLELAQVGRETDGDSESSVRAGVSR